MINSIVSWFQQSSVNEDSFEINQFCAIYWDIENIKVQNGESAVQLIKLIRDTVIRGNDLDEIEFVAVFGKGKLFSNIEHEIKRLGVEVYDELVDHDVDAADWKIIELITRFVKIYGPGCSLVLISGDSDFVKTLYRCKIHYDVKIYLVHFYSHKNDFLDAIADEVYLFMEDKQLRQVTNACDVAVINVKLSSEAFHSSTIEDDLLSMFKDKGVTSESIYFDERDKVCIWIGFPSKELAKNVEHKQPDHKLFSDIKYVQYPPYHVIRQLKGRNIGSVREETLKTLRLMNPRLLSSSRDSLIPSTLSLAFKTIPVYLIVTGFPQTLDRFHRCQYLATLLGKSFYSFRSTEDCVWFDVHQCYRAKEFIDKINNSYCHGSKLSVTVEQQLPGQVMAVKKSNEAESYQSSTFSSQSCKLAGLILLAVTISVLYKQVNFLS